MELPRPDADFDVLSAVPPLVDGAARVVIPDVWQQGRGTYGGLVAAIVVRALEQAAPGRALRSLTAEMCGPVLPGEAVVRVERLREGSAVTTVAARIVQGGEVQAHGVGVLGKTRMTDRDQRWLAPPSGPSWAEVEAIPIEPPLGPVFAQHVEYRPMGRLPLSGPDETAPAPELWIRLKHPGQLRDAAYLAGSIDAPWPALYVAESEPRPMATIAFTFQPLGSFEGLDPEAPLRFRSKLVAVDGGYCVENRELWGADGRLLALNQQTMVIIK